MAPGGAAATGRLATVLGDGAGRDRFRLGSGSAAGAAATSRLGTPLAGGAATGRLGTPRGGGAATGRQAMVRGGGAATGRQAMARGAAVVRDRQAMAHGDAAATRLLVHFAQLQCIGQGVSGSAPAMGRVRWRGVPAAAGRAGAAGSLAVTQPPSAGLRNFLLAACAGERTLTRRAQDTTRSVTSG